MKVNGFCEAGSIRLCDDLYNENEKAKSNDDT